jgi:putative ABC transport system permease protein
VNAALAIGRDLRFAVKSLARSPGFVLIAVITLGLGIGANTSMFSILNGYMLRPTPYPNRDRLDRIFRATRQDSRGGVSPADYLDLKSDASGYGDIAAYASSDISLAEPGKPAEVAPGLRVTANLFSTLGATPFLGRGFRPGEEVLGNDHVLVLSHRYWLGRFGGDSHVIGRTVRVDGEPYEIVGVLPANFSDWRHLSWVDAFRPLALSERETHDRNAATIRIVGLRSPAVSPGQAQAFIANFGRRQGHDFPAADADTTWRTVAIDGSFLDKDGWPVLGMLIALSGLVVLIACSNLANLFLARTMARAREFAVRSALGASGSQVLRPLAVESLLVAFAGGLCAVLVALWTFDWLAVVSAEPGGNGVGVDLTLDWRVLGWMFVVCLFTALAFGVAPAHFVHRLDLNSTLKSGSRGMTGDRRHRSFRDVLIVGQFALAMVLLAGAALFVRGFHEINTRRHGWQSDHLVTGRLVLPASRYATDSRITDFQRRTLERVEALPGVASASLSYEMPFFGLAEPRRYVVAGRETPQPGHEPAVMINGVTPHYFETVGTRLLSGRAFNESDTFASPKVFVINQAMASGLFGDESPIGRRIAQAGGKALEWGEVIGVVGDVDSVYANRRTGDYQLYQPMAQEPRPTNDLAVRTAGVAPSNVIDSIRAAVAALDPDLPVRKLEPAVTTIARSNYQDGVLGSMLSGLAVLGLGLASLGVYGIVARTVAQRTGEFGIRMALGAQARDIARLVLASGAKLALVGSAIGLLGAVGISRLIMAFFPGLQTSSVPVLIGTTVLLIGVAQLACYMPARHASRVSPSEALRAE